MNVVRDRLSPMTQPARLIVIVAFSRADNGELVPACCPMLFDTPEEISGWRAIWQPEMLAVWRGAAMPTLISARMGLQPSCFTLVPCRR